MATVLYNSAGQAKIVNSADLRIFTSQGWTTEPPPVEITGSFGADGQFIPAPGADAQFDAEALFESLQTSDPIFPGVGGLSPEAQAMIDAQNPFLNGGGPGESGGIGESGSSFDPGGAVGLLIDSFRGAEDITDVGFGLINGITNRLGLSSDQVLNAMAQANANAQGNDPLFDFLLRQLQGGRGGRGRRGGGGRAAPVFVGSVRADIEEQMRMYLISMVGQADDGRIKQLADLVQNIERHNFDNPAEPRSIDSEVRTVVRNYDDYKRIHELRPDNVDEAQWISSQAGALLRAGLDPQFVDQRAIQAAQVGASQDDVASFANVATVQQTGRALPGFVNNFRAAAQAIAEIV